MRLLQVVLSILYVLLSQNIAKAQGAGGGGGQCGDTIEVDCASAKIKMGGKESDIACGEQTGSTGGKDCTIGEKGEGTGGALSDGSPGLGAGKPKVLSQPVECLCNNCVFHEGSVGLGASSKGCVHVTPEVLKQLEGCKGAKFSIKGKGGGSAGGGGSSSGGGSGRK